MSPVLAMIAQIRTGLWVRNGFAIRGQLLHYRDFMLRELCYDQDIFILQTALVILDPSLVFVTVLDRFGLLSYFTGAIIEATYEGPQLGSMVEEVLYLLITLVSENANAKKMPLRTAVRREIVHALAMGPCSFTDLVKRVAERMVDDLCFEQVLREVANFKPPDGTTDTGVYELKDEAFQEVNPFFYHYTRNKREEVEVVLQNRMMKKGVKEPVIVPKQLGIEYGPFKNLAVSFESEALLQIMFYGIFNILVLTESSGTTPPSAEAILDQSLHLVMLALVERPVVFCRLAAVKSFEEDKNLIDVICTLEHHEKYKTYNPRVEWILARFEEHVPEEIQARRRVLEADRVKSPDPADAKKRAAKARQDAIMKQMKAQQANFAFNFDEDDEDEDMEDTPEEQVSYGTCIVCQEDLNGTRHFGGLALLQPSRLIRRHPDSHNLYLNEVLQIAPSMDRSPVSASDTSFPPPDAHIRDVKSVSSTNFEGFPAQYTRFGLHSSVCGHMMHLDCFQNYSVSIRQRHRAQATRNHPENIPRKEFICPLCKSLGNIILPITRPSTTTALSITPFPDWIRAAGIGILRSKPDPTLDSLQFRNGTGEFVFWSAQDPGYISFQRHSQQESISEPEIARMVDTIMVVSKNLSQQTRHLRDRPEPEPGERGAGIYLPEEVVGYSIAAMEVAHRGIESQGLIVDSLTDQQLQMIRGILVCLAKIAAMQLKGRSDGGRDAIKQAIIKRLLPEWSRTSLTSFSYPLLLRDPFTVLVETAAVAPEMLRHVLVLTYYACLARTVIGLVYVLNKTRSYSTTQIPRRNHEDIFGDVRMFFMSVVRHSPVFEHTATLVFETFGEARIEKLLYAFTLPFLRRAAILCRAVLPSAFATPSFQGNEPCEYNRLLSMLSIPALSDLPNQDTLQNALSGWCAHYGHSHAASQLNCGVVLDYPAMYRIARLPVVLDNLFGGRDKAMKCSRCETVPVDAAICLICGTTCCMQSHCCIDGEANDRGECNMHTRESVTQFLCNKIIAKCSTPRCGGAIGVYFLVKRCSLLYLYANNGTFAQSPYLDVHGEVDVSMRFVTSTFR